MKVTMQFVEGFVATRQEEGKWTTYEKVEDNRVTVEGVEMVKFGAGLVLERGELLFYYDDKFLVHFNIEPEALRTKLKSEANEALAALQDCDRCRDGDVLLPCCCVRWCGAGKCMSEDGLATVDKGPRLASPWDKEANDPDDLIVEP